MYSFPKFVIKKSLDGTWFVIVPSGFIAREGFVVPFETFKGAVGYVRSFLDVLKEK